MPSANRQKNVDVRGKLALYDQNMLLIVSVETRVPWVKKIENFPLGELLLLAACLVPVMLIQALLGACFPHFFNAEHLEYTLNFYFCLQLLWNIWLWRQIRIKLFFMPVWILTVVMTILTLRHLGPITGTLMILSGLYLKFSPSRPTEVVGIMDVTPAKNERLLSPNEGVLLALGGLIMLSLYFLVPHK